MAIPNHPPPPPTIPRGLNEAIFAREYSTHIPQLGRQPKNEDELKYGDNLKFEDDLKRRQPKIQGCKNIKIFLTPETTT